MALTHALVRAVTEDLLHTHLQDFLDLDALCFEKEAWDSQAFTSALPEKFDLSLSLWDEGVLYGYAMVSRKPSWLHIHRYAVHPERQGKGYGKIILQALRNAHPQDTIGLKVAVNNLPAIHFYLSKGFVFTAQSNGYYTLLLKP